MLLVHATVASKQIADKIDPLKPRILTRSDAPNRNPFSTSQCQQRACMQYYMSNVSPHRTHVGGCILRLHLNTTSLTRPHSDCDWGCARSSETAGDMQIDIVPDHLTVLCISAHVLELEDKIDLVLYLAAALQGVGAQVGSCNPAVMPTCYEVHVFSAHASVIDFDLGCILQTVHVQEPKAFLLPLPFT